MTEEKILFTQSVTVQRVSQRIILALAATLKGDKEKPLSLYLRDMSQAYIQSRTPLVRDFYARPPPELGLPVETILKVSAPFIGYRKQGTTGSRPTTSTTVNNSKWSNPRTIPVYYIRTATASQSQY
jgi:hypothetical protein